MGRREFPGDGRPLLDGVGEAVVHLEAEDAAMAALKAQDWQKEKEDDEVTEISKHLSLKFPRTLERFALGKEEDNEWIEKQWKKKILEDEEESAFGEMEWVREFALLLLHCWLVFGVYSGGSRKWL